MGLIIGQVVERHDGSSITKRTSQRICDKVIGSDCEWSWKYRMIRGGKISADGRMRILEDNSRGLIKFQEIFLLD
jgi:hypothetical protein